jgi:Rod binding domain-containing protein
VDPKIREAAEGLEAMFLNTMLQSMRGTVQESEYSLENPATKIYRGMLDSEVAKQTARNNSVGLADQVIAYLEQRGYNTNKAPVQGRTKPVADSRSSGLNPVSETSPPAIKPEARVRTGGTDAS